MRALAGLLALVLLAFAAPAGAASFDCRKVTAADELAVCRDGTLSALDSEMAGLFFAYDKVPLLMGANGARQDDAEAFLAERRACGPDLTCLRRVYTARIAVLKGDIEASMKQFFDLQNNTPPITAPIPPGVETIIAGYGEQCKALGGRLDPVRDRPGILTGDLDGDGIADYVLNTQPLQCSDSATAFCGNGGCQVAIALSSNGFADTLDAQGGMPMLVQGETGTIAKLWVDRTNCPNAQPEDACWASYSWSGGRSAVTYAVEPVPVT